MNRKTYIQIQNLIVNCDAFTKMSGQINVSGGCSIETIQDSIIFIVRTSRSPTL